MKLMIKGMAAALIMLLAMPAAAQDKAADDAKILTMLQQAYKAEPLTAEQEARLPAATQAVAVVLPDGFYVRMMQTTMDRTLGPLFNQLAIPSTDQLAEDVGYERDAKPDLDEAERKRLMAILDPAADQRTKLMLDTLTQGMSDMMGKMEGPIREGLAKAYAVRFNAQQLADINAFFATPTGRLYASQSMEAFTDPQTMGKMMESMPIIMQQMPQMMSGLDAKMATLPKPRSFADLTPAERQELAGAFGITVEQLRAGMAKAAKKKQNAD
jgi:hypothetical protein